MTSISKTCDKCMKCLHVDNCDEKRMVACGLMEMGFKPNIAESNVSMNTITNTITNTIQTMNSIINDKTISTQIEEQFKKDFYRRYNFLCDFNK